MATSPRLQGLATGQEPIIPPQWTPGGCALCRAVIVAAMVDETIELDVRPGAGEHLPPAPPRLMVSVNLWDTDGQSYDGTVSLDIDGSESPEQALPRMTVRAALAAALARGEDTLVAMRDRLEAYPEVP
jgi:hypothetical protein